LSRVIVQSVAFQQFCKARLLSLDTSHRCVPNCNNAILAKQM